MISCCPLRQDPTSAAALGNPRVLSKLQGNGSLLSTCNSDFECGSGLYCFSCLAGRIIEIQFKCIRRRVKPIYAFPKGTSLPFNKYSWLTTHNSFSIFGSSPQTGAPIVTFFNQEDSVLDQLNNGVRGLMLDMYDFRNDVWLCHSFGGHCHEFTAFRPANETLAEIRTFLEANPTEVVTIFIEDYVLTLNAITKLFTSAGLTKYWMPVAVMPSNGSLWPTLEEMIQRNHRLVVFTQNETKEATEGVAYQWRYTTENQYGDSGLWSGSCPRRINSTVLNDTSRSLIVQNYFPTNPNAINACRDNSEGLFNMLRTCYIAAGDRWSNYVAVDFYKRSTGGGAFHAVDFLNEQMQCSCQDATKPCSADVGHEFKGQNRERSTKLANTIRTHIHTHKPVDGFRGAFFLVTTIST